MFYVGSESGRLEGNPCVAFSPPISETDAMISRFVLPIITAVLANILLPPLPAAIVTVFCVLSAFADLPRQTTFVVQGRPFWNPVHVFYRPWSCELAILDTMLSIQNLNRIAYGLQVLGSTATGQKLPRGAETAFDAPRS